MVKLPESTRKALEQFAGNRDIADLRLGSVMTTEEGSSANTSAILYYRSIGDEFVFGHQVLYDRKDIKTKIKDNHHILVNNWSKWYSDVIPVLNGMTGAALIDTDIENNRLPPGNDNHIRIDIRKDNAYWYGCFNVHVRRQT